MTLTVGSLFSGVGGADLAFEQEGFKVVYQVEKDKFCQKVLKKHWPDVYLHDDVETFLTGEEAHKELVADIICGGFP